MRILHILQSNKLSGAENVVADICMMFNKDHEMVYCSRNGTIRDALIDRNVNYIPIKKLCSTEIKRVIKAFKPDIIHAHDVRATVLAAWVSGRIPLISQLHGNAEDMRKLGIKPLLYMLSIKKAKKVIAVSRSCLNDYIFKRQIEKKTISLRNIIYTPRIEKLMLKDSDEYNFDFVYIGRICYPKNPKRVAKVASAVLKECPNATFGVIGEGELKSEMEDVFRKEGVSDRVVFTGRLSYPYKAMKQAKCMLMCSRFEGTPIAVLEAMNLGVPIVSTPVDGMIDIVEDGNTGYLLSEDEVLSQAVIEMIIDKKKQERFSYNSIKRFESLNNQEQYKAQLEKIYFSVLRGT